MPNRARPITMPEKSWRKAGIRLRDSRRARIIGGGEASSAFSDSSPTHAEPDAYPADSSIRRRCTPPIFHLFMGIADGTRQGRWQGAKGFD